MKLKIADAKHKAKHVSVIWQQLVSSTSDW